MVWQWAPLVCYCIFKSSSKDVRLIMFVGLLEDAANVIISIGAPLVAFSGL